jgi:O-antigen/teichoic acid export membrane protein
LQKSYTKNYFKIYTAQLFAVVFNVLSLVIVIPFLSNNSKVYGIYSLCVSFTIFLSYADLGFLNAGYKYASEYYAKNNKQKEIEITGFVCFILSAFILIFAVVLMLFAFHPYWLIKNISDTKDIYIAKHLLLILALFSPNMILQRTLQIIYGVRVHDYIFQTILIIINASKIASVYFFVTDKEYNIIGYFLFCQIVTSAGLIVGVLYAAKKFSISLKALTAHIRFSKETFQSIKGLAFSSLYVTIAWILFYEFDPYAIARLAGAEAVAFYSIGLTCLAFFRSIFGTLFGPFNARFNHFVAMNDFSGLANFTKTVVRILLPAVVFPTLSLAILSKPFVFAWVGDKFNQSVSIVTFLSLCNILGFITYPSSILSMATKKIKLLYIISTVQLIVYWCGIAIFFSSHGFIVFAWFELICFSITGILYTSFMCRFLQVNIFQFMKIIIAPAVPPIIVLIIILFSVHNFLPAEKSKLNLFEVVSTGAGAAIIATLVYYFTSKTFKNYIDGLLVKFKQTLIRTLDKKHVHFI